MIYFAGALENIKVLEFYVRLLPVIERDARNWQIYTIHHFVDARRRKVSSFDLLDIIKRITKTQFSIIKKNHILIYVNYYKF